MVSAISQEILKGLEYAATQEQEVEILPRDYPPVSAYDTVIYEDGNYVSAHGQACFLNDSDIARVIQKHARYKEVAYSPENAKAVVQQQATRGCTAAVAAMLALDNKKDINWKKLRSRNLGTTKDIKRDLKAVGLIPISTRLPAKAHKAMEKLAKIIQANGSAIVAVTDRDLGGHTIIVDSIHRDDTAIIRDPYHGWQVQVTQCALLRILVGGTAIQVVSK